MSHSPAEGLAAAADKLDALAGAATDGQWRDVSMGSEGSTIFAGGQTVSTSRRVARAGGFEDAAYIAATNPLVGKALAEWLLDERVRAMNAGTDPNSHALALARLIIGGAE